MAGFHTHAPPCSSLPTRPRVGRKTSGPRHWGPGRKGTKGQWEQEAHCGGSWLGQEAVPAPFGVEAEQAPGVRD